MKKKINFEIEKNTFEKKMLFLFLKIGIDKNNITEIFSFHLHLILRLFAHLFNNYLKNVDLKETEDIFFTHGLETQNFKILKMKKNAILNAFV
jgi:hypothetical protein